MDTRASTEGPLVATSPSGVREVELTRGEGRVGRVEEGEEMGLEMEGVGIGVQVDPMTDTLVDNEVWEEPEGWAWW